MAKKPQITLSLSRVLALSVTLSCLILLLAGLAFYFLFSKKIYPGTYIDSVYVGGLTETQAIEKLTRTTSLPEHLKVILSYPEPTEYSIPLIALDAKIDYITTAKKAYTASRKRPIFKPKKVSVLVNYDEDKLNEQIELIGSESPNPPENPRLVVNQNDLVFVQGKVGTELNRETLKTGLINALNNRDRLLNIKPDTVDPTLNSQEEEDFVQRGRALLAKSLVLVLDNYSIEYNKQQLINFLHPHGGYVFNSASPSLPNVALSINTPPKNPVFTYQEGMVKEFSPAADGLEVDLPKLQAKIAAGLTELESTAVDSVHVDIPVKKTPPAFATEDVNNLGIKELIGEGKSSFRGSIPSRVYNISLAASRLNGILIKPGEVFSFVNTLGDISVFTGYKQAYVISGGQTILGDGGGVCQVSTTFFRAALNAGLPIVERHAHSYRVGYYEQDSPPGIDATIFHPTVDLKIKNDTPGHILIQTFADSKNSTLRFEFYGTSDGRVATITKPAVSSVTPPPEDSYTDDPSLPEGEIKQIDYKAWGAKVSFNYKVERNGETLFENTFYSNYRPWQAKFLRGTGPAQ